MNNNYSLQINTPNDSQKTWDTNVSFWLNTEEKTSVNVGATSHFIRSAKDPVHAGLVSWWTNKITPPKRRRRYGYYGNERLKEYEATITIGSLPIILTKNKSRYSINGKAERLSTIANVLARVTFKSAFEKSPLVLMKSLTSFLSTPEEIKYCLENRVPYHFYDDFVKKECRLNLQQISKSECAIELSDGIWGTISNKDLVSFYTFYGLEKKRKGKWQFLSPKSLFLNTVGREPSNAELTLMIEFLQQNRTQDIVDKRAIELVNDLLAQHKDRLHAEYDGEKLSDIYVKGKDYDWKLTSDPYKSNIQMVSTYVWQPRANKSTMEEEMEIYHKVTEEEIAWNTKNPDNERPMPERPVNEWQWKGPICIDNMAPNSPIGDQFGARALALLNDTFTIRIVNTISRYLISETNTNRVDFDEMSGM